MKTNTRKQMLKRFRWVKVQLHISMKLSLDHIKLLRITAHVLRFMENCRNKSRQGSSDITTKETNKARLIWVKKIQTLLVTDINF